MEQQCKQQGTSYPRGATEGRATSILTENTGQLRLSLLCLAQISASEVENFLDLGGGKWVIISDMWRILKCCTPTLVCAQVVAVVACTLMASPDRNLRISGF